MPPNVQQRLTEIYGARLEQALLPGLWDKGTNLRREHLGPWGGLQRIALDMPRALWRPSHLNAIRQGALQRRPYLGSFRTVPGERSVEDKHIRGGFLDRLAHIIKGTLGRRGHKAKNQRGHGGDQSNP